MILYYFLVLVDLFVFFVSFAVIVYGMCHVRPGEMKGTLVMIFSAPAFKYVLKMIVSPFVDGFPTSNALIMDLYTYGVSCALEMLQFVLVLVLTYSSAKKYRELKLFSERSSGKKRTELIVPPELVPFKKIVSFKNPLQVGAVASAAVIVVGRVLSLAISDLSRKWKITGINQYLSFFAPYIIEVLVGVIGYFFMLYIYILMYSKENKDSSELSE